MQDGTQAITEIEYTDLEKRGGFQVSFSARNNEATDDDYFAVDNIAMYQYGKTIANFATETDAREIKIPLTNDYDFNDKNNAPELVKK